MWILTTQSMPESPKLHVLPLCFLTGSCALRCTEIKSCWAIFLESFHGQGTRMHQRSGREVGIGAFTGALHPLL